MLRDARRRRRAALRDAYADTLERKPDAFGEPPADTWISRPRDTLDA